MCDEIESLNSLVLDKINFGEWLIESTEEFSTIEGLQKLQRKIKQELNFLKKVYKNKNVKKEHLQCSNLTHFSALIDTLRTVNSCTNVNKVFMLDDRKITVDIVCDNGLTWMKVVARNPRSISHICLGNASYGVRSVLDQAEEYIECSKLYPCLFQTPKIIFVFANGIEQKLAERIESYGISVVGTRLTNLDIIDDIESLNDDTNLLKEPSNRGDLSTINTSNINKVNLDVSAMLAYVSSVTNGSADKYEFSVPVLAQQAKWECLRPQKPILDAFFKGKRLFCCQTAMDNFKNILHTVGGENEKKRAEEFIERITVLPDDATVENNSEDNENSEVFCNVQFTPDKFLQIGGKIRERSLIIFTFGDKIQAVTVTANDGFVRAAKQQGINFVVFLHESRALTEQKEQTRATSKKICS